MADQTPPPVAPERARFLIVTDNGDETWAEALRKALKNETPFVVKRAANLAAGLEGIDEWLKAAGDVDEVVLCVWAADASGDAEAVRRAVEKLVYRVVLYQVGNRPAPRVTLVVPPGLAKVAAVYQEVALGLDTRFVNAADAKAEELPAKVAGVFAAGEAPEPPSEVKVAAVEGTGAKVTWVASPTKSVIGYEVHDAEEEGTMLTTTITTEATLPEGHDACLVRARDGAGRVSKGIRSHG